MEGENCIERDNWQERAKEFLKDLGHMVDSHDPFSDVVVISYKPSGANLVEIFCLCEWPLQKSNAFYRTGMCMGSTYMRPSSSLVRAHLSRPSP